MISRKALWLVTMLVLVAGCRDATPLEDHRPTRPTAPVDARRASVDASAFSPASRTPTPKPTGIHTHDGRTSAHVEWVDADVIRVRSLRTISVEANEIRCPRIARTKSPPVQKDMGWRRIEGDVVEVDQLSAHHVTARLIVADEISAVLVRRRSKIHRWVGAGSGAEVRNRVVRVDPSTGVATPLIDE